MSRRISHDEIKKELENELDKYLPKVLAPIICSYILRSPPKSIKREGGFRIIDIEDIQIFSLLDNFYK